MSRLNFQQRLALSFLLFSLVSGVISAPVHGLSPTIGLIVGFVTYAIFAIGAIVVLWTVEGNFGPILKVFEKG